MSLSFYLCTARTRETYLAFPSLEEKLIEVNSFHESLKFTQEEESEGTIPFLDMNIKHNEDGTLASTWYCKPSDTGLIMNFHALTPMRYKRAVVC